MTDPELARLARIRCIRHDVFLSTTIDRDSIILLNKMTMNEAEGNRSRMIRQIIREAAERRGLTLSVSKAKE